MNIPHHLRIVVGMRTCAKYVSRFSLIGLVTGLLAGPAAADCYADYKAKQDDPLELHYGVIELPTLLCENSTDAEDTVAQRIAADGWTLLNVMSLFDDSGLKERQESAGDFYLRY